jgi:hypothetical protein
VLLAKSFEMGQPALAPCAAASNCSCVAPGTVAVVVRVILVMANPPSTLASVTAASVSIFSAVSPEPPSCAPWRSSLRAPLQ